MYLLNFELRPGSLCIMDPTTFAAEQAVRISLQDDDDEFLGDDDFQYDAAVISSEEIGQSP